MKVSSEEELAEVIAPGCGPFCIRGGGTRGMGLAVGAEDLDMSGLSGISLYEPGALTLVVKAGTPLAEVEAVLAADGQRLAFEPADWRGLLGTKGVPTVGGMVAGNISGPRRVQAGACRDALLGVRFVDGTGALVKNGGRVMKNVTGYDLVKLMAGSWGTLGVLTEVGLKVLPVPEAEATLVLDGLSAIQAQEAMTRALTSPFDVTGAAHVPGQGTMIRIEGFAQSVAYRSGQLQALLGQKNALHVETDMAKSRAIWRDLRNVAAFEGKPGDVWRLSCRASLAPGLVEAIKQEWPVEAIYDWGGGLIWLLTPEGADIRAVEFGGHATLLRASAKTRARIATFQPEPAPLAAISAGIRARFDPRGIFNPGLMG
ncbi:MAG: FAD-binding protein [Albidovulum sp.]